MTNLISKKEYLPSNPKELAPFVAVGSVAVNTARQLLKSGKLTKEQYDSVLRKGQEQGEVVLDAKEELGRLSAALPKAQGQRTELMAAAATSESKKQSISDLGLTQRQASRYEQIAANPEAKEKAAKYR